MSDHSQRTDLYASLTRSRATDGGVVVDSQATDDAQRAAARRCAARTYDGRGAKGYTEWPAVA